MTPAQVIELARTTLQDEDATFLRYSDAVLSKYLHRAMLRISIARPDLFTTIGNIACIPGTIQTVPNRGRVVEIFQVAGGTVVDEVDRGTLDRQAPSWRSATPAPPVNWVRHPRNPSVFFVYPPAVGDELLVTEYTIAPSETALGDQLPLDDRYLPVAADMLVAEVEWGDNENVMSGRADKFYQRAMEALGVSLQVRALSDDEDAGNQQKGK
jgi:hypothetical protein